jgi:hypothetical protein
MGTSEQQTHFGRIYPPDEAWLAKQPPEPILDPDLPIIDPHHRLWDRPNHRDLHRTVRAGPLHVREQFPRGKMGISWAAPWNAFKRIAAGASAEEKRALFSGTARRVYRVD